MSIFADTSGWANLLDSKQQHHQTAVSILNSLQQNNQQFVTTNYVLTELVALLTSPLRFPRKRVIRLMNDMKNSKFVRVVHIDETLDTDSWELLSKRSDKTWSLVDCSSFVVMQRQKLTEALTTDHHFTQAGFVSLLKIPE